MYTYSSMSMSMSNVYVNRLCLHLMSKYMSTVYLYVYVYVYI